MKINEVPFVYIEDVVFQGGKKVGTGLFINQRGLKGWFGGVPVRMAQVPIPQQHGSFPSPGVYGDRTVTITGEAVANSAAELRALELAFTNLFAPVAGTVELLAREVRVEAFGIAEIADGFLASSSWDPSGYEYTASFIIQLWFPSHVKTEVPLLGDTPVDPGGGNNIGVGQFSGSIPNYSGANWAPVYTFNIVSAGEYEAGGLLNISINGSTSAQISIVLQPVDGDVVVFDTGAGTATINGVPLTAPYPGNMPALVAGAGGLIPNNSIGSFYGNIQFLNAEVTAPIVPDGTNIQISVTAPAGGTTPPDPEPEPEPVYPEGDPIGLPAIWFQDPNESYPVSEIAVTNVWDKPYSPVFTFTFDNLYPGVAQWDLIVEPFNGGPRAYVVSMPVAAGDVFKVDTSTGALTREDGEPAGGAIYAATGGAIPAGQTWTYKFYPRQKNTSGSWIGMGTTQLRVSATTPAPKQ